MVLMKTETHDEILIATVRFRLCRETFSKPDSAVFSIERNVITLMTLCQCHVTTFVAQLCSDLQSAFNVGQRNFCKSGAATCCD